MTALLLLAVATALIVMLTDEVRHIVRRTTDAELHLTFGDTLGVSSDPHSGLPRALVGMAVLERASSAEVRRVIGSLPVAVELTRRSALSRATRAAAPETVSQEWLRRVWGRHDVTGVTRCNDHSLLSQAVIEPHSGSGASLGWCITPPPASPMPDGMHWYLPSGSALTRSSQTGPIGREDLVRADESDLVVGQVVPLVQTAVAQLNAAAVCVGTQGPTACDDPRDQEKEAARARVEVGQVEQIYYMSVRSDFHVWWGRSPDNSRPRGSLWAAYADMALVVDGLYVSTPYLDGAGRGFVATACAPIFAGMHVTGVLCADFPIRVEAPRNPSPSIRVHQATVACAPASDAPHRLVPRLLTAVNGSVPDIRGELPGLSSVRLWPLDVRQIDAMLPMDLCGAARNYGRPMRMPLSHMHNIDGLWAIPIRDTGGGTVEVWFVEDVDIPLLLGTLGAVYGIGALLALALATRAHRAFATRVIQQAQRARLRGIGAGIVLADFSGPDVRYVSGNERAEELLGCEFVSVDLDGNSGPDHSAAKLLYDQFFFEFVREPATDDPASGRFVNVTVTELRARRRHGLASDYFARRRDVPLRVDGALRPDDPPAWVQFHSTPLAFAGGTAQDYRAVSAVSEAPEIIADTLERRLVSALAAAQRSADATPTSPAPAIAAAGAAADPAGTTGARQ